MVILIVMFALLAISASAAETYNSKSSVDCGGLFLLHTSDKQFSIRECSERTSLEVKNLTLYGSLAHYSIMGRYSDKWDIKGKNDLKFGSAGFESRFKYTTLGVDVSSLPFIRSKIDIHHPDSLFYIGASLAKADPEIGNIRWISENKRDFVHEISVDWQTHILYKGLSAGSKIGNQQFEIRASLLETDPQNPDKEYYVRDSVQALILGGNYGITLGNDTLQATYTFADADIYLYGIMHQEESRKRFLYVPLEAQIHIAEAKWKRRNLQAHLDFVYVNAEMESNPDRFFETFAPNRALPTSVLKALSFSFLQKNFRVDTDLDAMGLFGGAAYQWPLGHKFVFTPKVSIDGYYAQGEADIRKKTETKVIISTQSYVEEYTRKLSSFGSVLHLGSELSFGNLAIEYSLMQLIPFHISYKEVRPGEDTDSNKQESSKKGNGSKGDSREKDDRHPQDHVTGEVPNKASAAFRNGFATNFSLIYRI